MGENFTYSVKTLNLHNIKSSKNFKSYKLKEIHSETCYQNVNNQRENLKRGKRDVSCNVQEVSLMLTANFSSEIMEAGKQ